MSGVVTATDSCVIDTCADAVDLTELVVMAIPVAPYTELRPACRPHLDALREIGLPVREVERDVHVHGA